MASVLTVDSAAQQNWLNAVEEINTKVEQIYQELSQIIEDLASSDQGGTIGETLTKMASEYLSAFKDLVSTVVEFIETVSTFVKNVVTFVEEHKTLLTNIAKVVAIFI